MTDVMDTGTVLEQARELLRFYQNTETSKPYTCSVLADCIVEIERLRAASEWRDISTAPRDGTPVDLWHRVWCCPITVQWKIDFISDLPWIEKTKTTAWPMEAFSHWRQALAPPQRNEVKK